MKQEIGYAREFLNQPYKVSTTSNISYNVKVSTYRDDLKKLGMYTCSDINFSISDCSKVIDLDFDINTEEDYLNSQYKLDRIIEVCKKMKQHLLEARILIIQGQAKLKELENEKNIQ